MQTSTDRELIQAVLAGDKAAFGQVYDRYAPLIRAICFDHTLNLSDAQDLAQDVFVRAYEKLDCLRDPDRCRAWLMGIARLRCREWQRSKSRIHTQALESDCVDRESPSVESDLQERLRELVFRLPDKERLVLHQYYLLEQPVDRVRKQAALSRSGFYSVLKRARARLKHWLLLASEEIL